MMAMEAATSSAVIGNPLDRRFAFNDNLVTIAAFPQNR